VRHGDVIDNDGGGGGAHIRVRGVTLPQVDHLTIPAAVAVETGGVRILCEHHGLARGVVVPQLPRARCIAREERNGGPAGKCGSARERCQCHRCGTGSDQLPQLGSSGRIDGSRHDDRHVSMSGSGAKLAAHILLCGLIHEKMHLICFAVFPTAALQQQHSVKLLRRWHARRALELAAAAHALVSYWRDNRSIYGISGRNR
jgi:hypothetical protein